jgi:hypothetical protein
MLSGNRANRELANWGHLFGCRGDIKPQWKRKTHMHSVFVLLTVLVVARGGMIRNDSISNDPAKEKLCIERAGSAGLGKVKIVPFEIDSDFLARARSPQYGGNPKKTFIAVESSLTSQLIECDVNPGTGRYGPMVLSSERPGVWRLIKPKQFEPGIDTREGIAMAGNACRQAAQLKINSGLRS